MRRAFTQVDVFTETAYQGNPLAVVLDGAGLSTEEMQHFAHWTNLSETTFVLAPTSPEADYRVRIFTPTLEAPFAGHPTLGTCHAWLAHAGQPKRPGVIVQECGIGLVPVRTIENGLAFAAPPLLRSGALEAELRERIAGILRLEPSAIVDAAWCDNGLPWIGILLADAEAVLAVRPGFSELDLGLVGPHPDDGPADFEVRAFFPKEGAVVEDPVTGSLNASLAEWLIGSDRAHAPYTARQGTALGRSGRVHISTDADGTIWVGGATVDCIAGIVDL